MIRDKLLRVVVNENIGNYISINIFILRIYHIYINRNLLVT